MNGWNRLSTKSRLMIALGLLVAVVGGIYFMQTKIFSLSKDAPKKSVKSSIKYHCPMHPSVISDEPGSCPICHMDLQPIDDGGHVHSSDETSEGDQSKERKILFYRHPMRGDITSSTPAKDEMGMDYIPVYEDEIDSDDSATSLEGRAGFNLNEQRQQLIGVTYATVTKSRVTRTIQSTGSVAFDPELYTVIEEYRQALEAKAALKDSSFGSIQGQTDALVQSAKTRLKLLGISDEQIRNLGQSRVDPISLILPKGKAWVYAEVFEYEAGALKQGLLVEASSPSAPGEKFIGRVSSISRVITQPARTVRVRAEVDDPKGLLRPDTYLNVTIHIELGEHLSIPEDAVLFSQGKAYVFYVKEKGRFEPRVIELGEKAEGKYVVLSGLNEGDQVVKSANFLLDSEAKLRSVLERASSSGGSAK